MRRGASALFVSLLPAAASACAVCFGSSSPDMIRGFYWGVVLLLLLPPVMILSFVGFIVWHVRRHRRPSDASPQP